MGRNWKLQICAIFPMKWRPLKVFAKLCKSPLQIANIVKGAVSPLRQFLASKSPWKIMKNAFYFIVTNWICYREIRFCSYYAFSLNQMSDLPEVWKYWPLQDGFRSQKFSRAVILWWVDQKIFKLLADISFESRLQSIRLSSFCYFCELVIKLINCY